MKLLILGSFKKPFQSEIFGGRKWTHISESEVTRCWKPTQLRDPEQAASCVSFPRHAEHNTYSTTGQPEASLRWQGEATSPWWMPRDHRFPSFWGVKRTEEWVISMRENYTNCVARRKKYSKSEKWPFRTWWWQVQNTEMCCWPREKVASDVQACRQLENKAETHIKNLLVGFGRCGFS